VRFLWPAALGLYAGIPLLAGGYVVMLNRRTRQFVRFASFDLAAQAAAAGGRWRRHVPAVLYLLTFCAVIFSLARPVAAIPLPNNQTAVMLSIDVSFSMGERDVLPTRFEAAKHAAKLFVQGLPRGAKAGLVSFSDTATLVTPPTENHDRVLDAIDRLAIASETAIGEGILEAVYALPGRARPPQSAGVTPSGHTASDPGNLPPAAVVLLSDGVSNKGTDPRDAAGIARRLHVKVYTVGLGTPSDPGSLDETTLREIAETTGAEYHRAASTDQLVRAYRALGRSIAWTRQPVEISGFVSVGVAVLFLSTLVASIALTARLG
jgi:Ca-activated chloride channel family protein